MASLDKVFYRILNKIFHTVIVKAKKKLSSTLLSLAPKGSLHLCCFFKSGEGERERL